MELQGDVVRRPAAALASRPAVAVYVLCALTLALELTPGLGRFRLVERVFDEPASETPLAPEPMQVGAAEIEQASQTNTDVPETTEVVLTTPKKSPIAGRPVKLPDIDVEKPPVPIEDEGDRGLRGFYEALQRTDRKESDAITRVAHFGDSIVVSDYVSGTLRRKFQTQFGDAGHGFQLLAAAWPAYNHWDVYRFSSKGWRVSRIVGPLAEDEKYGYGCATFSAPPGCRSRFGTSEKTAYGKRVSRFVVAYYEQPDGGDFEVNVDGEHVALVETAAEKAGFATRTFDVEDGEHMLEVVTKRGVVRGFGVVMERTVPGVVWDAVGVQGARVRFLDKQDDEHWREQLRWRKPNLVVYQFGANESGDGFKFPMDEYHATFRAVLEQGKAALPEAGCLVIGAMDRAEKRGGGVRTMPVIPALVKEQRATAAEVGCAFFDTYRAMGGSGSMASWVEAGLGQSDMTHPSGSGANLVGNWIFQALLDGYDRYWRARAAGSQPEKADETRD